MTCLLRLNILLKYSDVASMTLRFFHQILVQHVIQLQFLQVFLENLFIFSDEVKKELPEAHIFFKILRRWFFHVLSWLVKGLLKLFNKGGSFHNAVNLSWIYVIEDFRWWNRIHFKWKLRQESDKFVGIDMDVKEILLNGYQIKAAKEFCNQGAYLKRSRIDRLILMDSPIVFGTSWLHHLLRDIYINKRLHKDIYIYTYLDTYYIL